MFRMSLSNQVDEKRKRKEKTNQVQGILSSSELYN